MSTFVDVTTKANRLARELGPAGNRRMILFLGRAARADYDSVIADDLGSDQAFRNWRRPPKKRLKISAGLFVVDDETVTVGPRLVGPFHVLDRGRKERAAQERYEIQYSDGPRGRRRRYAKAKRAVSATAGRNTSYRARVLIGKRTPQRAAAYTARRLAKAWR